MGVCLALGDAREEEEGEEDWWGSGGKRVTNFFLFLITLQKINFYLEDHGSFHSIFFYNENLQNSKKVKYTMITVSEIQ